MELATRYNAADVEKKWYQHWLDNRYFESKPDDREPFTILIPPPNVTGVLHMGHMLNNTIQDILIRRARVQGKNACWVPGTDHASIATEAKVVDLLRKQGLRKSDIGREKFLEHAFAWKEKYGGIILDQLKMLGASCDWSRTRFTMEESLSEAVTKVFVDLHKKGLIYRGLRMTNWDCEAKTVLSNEEVLYSEEQTKLYHIRYRLADNPEEFITIATTRPETILGDVAVAINPSDERYTHLQGREVIVPLVQRRVPIVFDDYVKTDFGTGIVKITPAHDVNDHELGQRHQLPVLDIMNLDGTLNKNAQFYVGMDRFAVRKQLIKDLEAQGHVAKIEDYTTKIGRSERTKSIVEPKLAEQWFVRMEKLAKTALDAVEKGDVRFFPENFINMYRSWLSADNVRDWCISRQLWWGQRIPAYYLDGEVVVAETAEAALAIFNQKRATPAQLSDLRQDEDVVDTWFSAWLWPISVFDGFRNPEELAYYYPTSVLVTGWDIMFFWVARMIMAGYEWSPELIGAEATQTKGAFPFKDVYFTGMVRDKDRRKMSKSLGNSPDCIELMEKYSADGVRFGIMSCSSVGNDVIFDAPFDDALSETGTKKILNKSKLCETGRNFTNKLWNALRLIKGWAVAEASEHQPSALERLATDWIEQKLSKTIAQVNGLFEQYRLSEALVLLYSFVWDDFCSYYLELIKPQAGEPIHAEVYARTVRVFEQITVLLHPFMPFITEEVWAGLRPRAAGEDCVVAQWPTAGAYDEAFLYNIETMKDAISKVREIRNQHQLSPKTPLELFIRETELAKRFLGTHVGLVDAVKKIANLKLFISTDNEIAQAVSFIVGTEQYYLAFERKIDVAAEREKLAKELEYAQGFVAGIEKKLGNERFVQNAKPEVVEQERKKLSDGLARVQLLQESLAKLS